MQLYIIDGIGPFFRGCDEPVINWSKAPFAYIERSGGLTAARCTQITHDFRTFCQRASEAGYNAVTLDDLAHLCDFPFYPLALREKITQYRQLFQALYQIAHEYGMQVFITTDLLFFNDHIDQHIPNNEKAHRQFAADCCRQLFEILPQTAGLIVRIGESDGLDVEGDFLSRLIINRPQQARRMVQALLPVFEATNRLLIFRTWSVGVGRVGDISWNAETFDRVFKGLENEHLIISMKYGQSDFFRYLPVNPLFFHGGHRKLIEFQARREYEGFGEYPSFIGWDYEKIRNRLTGQNIAGISVWCQTGGWSGFRRLTWLEDRAIWNEINAYVTVHMFRYGRTADQAIQSFCKTCLNTPYWRDLQHLLRLSDEVIKELLYIDDFASRRIYFRRLRVPPLVSVYWRYIVVNHFMRKFMRCYVSNGKRITDQGYAALRKIKKMQHLAEELNLPIADLRFQYDTFELIAVAREYYFLEFNDEIIERLKQLKSRYESRYEDPRYTIMLDFSHIRMRRTHLNLMLRILFRGEHGYRLLDRIVTLNILSAIYPLLKRMNKKFLPKFATESAMGLDSIFK